MSDVPMKAYWMGEDIDTLPRERLIEIIHQLGKMEQAARQDAHQSSKFAGDMIRLAARRS